VRYHWSRLPKCHTEIDARWYAINGETHGRSLLINNQDRLHRPKQFAATNRPSPFGARLCTQPTLTVRFWPPIGLIRCRPPSALAFTPARIISTASYALALTRPRATGTTELDDIGDVVVGLRTEAPTRGVIRPPHPVPIARIWARSAEHGAKGSSPAAKTLQNLNRADFPGGHSLSSDVKNARA
jgi:hypothetical protein